MERLLKLSGFTTQTLAEKRHSQQNEKYNEKDLGYAGCGTSDAGESKHSSNERQYEKSDGPV